MRKINLRTEQGWTAKVENKNKETCDHCGAKLWAGPSGVYCDKVHTKDQLKKIAGNYYRENKYESGDKILDAINPDWRETEIVESK